MHILSLHVQNIKKIKAVHIEPHGNTVVISGKNGQGKSSAIEAIAMALGGKKLIPEKPIREGETTAEIIVDLGKYTVRRHWTKPDTSYLTVTNKEGAQFKAGQDILNTIIGELSFDPLKFTTMDADKRVVMLKNLTGLDFSDLDAEYKKKYEERAQYGRDGNQLKSRLESEFILPQERPVLESIESIKASREKSRQYNLKITQAKGQLTIAEGAIKAENAAIHLAREKISRLEEEIKLHLNKIDGIRADAEKYTEMASLEPENVDAYDTLIEQHHRDSMLIERFEKRDAIAKELEQKRAKWNECDERLKAIGNEKVARIAAVQLPIRGLSFGEDDVLFDGIPFKQLSKAEQIKVSMCIACAANPQLKVAMIYDGSLLDKESMEQIAFIAEQQQLQVWIERVADEPDGQSVFIEDGCVKGAEVANEP